MSKLRKRISMLLPEGIKAVLKEFLPPTAEASVQAVGGEGPRGYVGGLWYEMGELQFKFLVEHGLLPEHTLLDIACGSLRLGNRIIPYLNSGNYLGIDIEADLIEHGKAIELGHILCDIKKPEFVVSGSFEFHRFSKPPDIVIAQSLFSHLIEREITLCLINLSKYCKGSTVLYATFNEVDAPAVNPARSDPHGFFRYTRLEMEQIGQRAGWKMNYLGNWNHPRDQKMLRYVVA
jgi:hypothetical protein